MECEIERDFTFTWNVYVDELIGLQYRDTIKSPISKAENLKKTQWYLEISVDYVLKHQVLCFLYRNKSDESKTLFITITFKLEIIDWDGNILKSVVRNNCSFAKGCTHQIDDFVTNNILAFIERSGKMSEGKWLTIRCHIIEENNRYRALAKEIPAVMQTQWKFDFLGPSNWSKNIKIPFHDYSHIDILLSAFKERINIKIEKLDLLQAYTLKITVFNNASCEIEFKESKNIFCSSGGEKTFTTWFEKSQLVDKSQCQLPYSFTLICVLSIASGNSSSDSIDESSPSKMASLLPLQEDLKEMFLKAKHSDIKLRSQDKVIPVHKCLLSARSPVFCTMFDQDMLETQTGIVDIPDVEHGTLLSFTEFLYTDTVTNTDFEEVLKLMLVADKYQVNALKERCSLILMSSLSLKNVCEVVSVSEMVNQSDLKSCAFDFIKRNKKKIISSPIWSNWVEKNMKLAVEILSKLIVD